MFDRATSDPRSSVHPPRTERTATPRVRPLRGTVVCFTPSCTRETRVSRRCDGRRGGGEGEIFAPRILRSAVHVAAAAADCRAPDEGREDGRTDGRRPTTVGRRQQLLVSDRRDSSLGECERARRMADGATRKWPFPPLVATSARRSSLAPSFSIFPPFCPLVPPRSVKRSEDVRRLVKQFRRRTDLPSESATANGERIRADRRERARFRFLTSTQTAPIFPASSRSRVILRVSIPERRKMAGVTRDFFLFLLSYIRSRRRVVSIRNEIKEKRVNSRKVSFSRSRKFESFRVPSRGRASFDPLEFVRSRSRFFRLAIIFWTEYFSERLDRAVIAGENLQLSIFIFFLFCKFYVDINLTRDEFSLNENNSFGLYLCLEFFTCLLTKRLHDALSECAVQL